MDWMTVLVTGGIAFLIFFVVALGMAVGVMAGRKPISGSCGGLNNRNGGASDSCSLCGGSTEACQDLRDRHEEQAGVY
jgi:hypothetical protein